MSERKTGLLTRARTVRADIAYDSHVNKMTARAKATLPLVTASLFPPRYGCLSGTAHTNSGFRTSARRRASEMRQHRRIEKATICPFGRGQPRRRQ